VGAARFGAPTVDDEPVGKVSKAEATALEADASADVSSAALHRSRPLASADVSSAALNRLSAV
jgi:hypothetical protein